MLQQNPILYYLLASVLLYWVMLLFASLYHAKGWTLPGMGLAVGSRDKMPERTVVMARADRAAKNMNENLVIFTAVALTAVVTGTAGRQVLLGAQIFLISRIIYWPFYLSGIAYLRTLIWSISLVGIAMIAAAILQIRLIG
jgi:uncharacterized MAPEG superfamily protein